MLHTWRLVILMIAMAALAAACSNGDGTAEPPPVFTPADGDASLAEPGTTLIPPTPPDPPEIEGPSLVDFAVPCGRVAQPTAAAGPGVSEAAIRVGTGNDEGGRFTGESGATMPEAVVAMAEHCNSLGGLAGRVVTVDFYDAAVTELGELAETQCREAFAMVGHGYVEPIAALDAWDGCNLSRFEGWPPGLLRTEPPPLLAHRLAAFTDPSALAAAIVLPDTFDSRGLATSLTEALTGAGFEIVATEFFSLTSEPDWGTLVRQVTEAGAGLVHLGGSCRGATVPWSAAAGDDGPTVVTGASSYDADCLADAAALGVSLEHVLVQLPFLPLEDGDAAPTTVAFAEILETYAARPTGDALLASAAFWEFAVAVDACNGAELTRGCLQDRRPSDWDGAGLHPGPEDLTCRVVMGIVDREFVRVLPEEPGRYGCADQS